MPRGPSLFPHETSFGLDIDPKLWFLSGFLSSCHKLQVVLNPAHEGQSKQKYRDLCFAFGGGDTFLFKPIVTVED